MAQPFTLRFVLADGQADSLDLSQVWEDEASARELEDDVIGLFAGEVLLARLVVLPADESRGKAVLHAIAQDRFARLVLRFVDFNRSFKEPDRFVDAGRLHDASVLGDIAKEHGESAVL